jgi:hypothetical protein
MRVPIEEGERMYTAMKKRHMPAKFIRYRRSPWRLAGVGHGASLLSRASLVAAIPPMSAYLAKAFFDDCAMAAQWSVVPTQLIPRMLANRFKTTQRAMESKVLTQKVLTWRESCFASYSG